MKWQEAEAENDRLINNILEEQGMHRDRMKAFVMFFEWFRFNEKSLIYLFIIFHFKKKCIYFIFE